jgi:hypothetical protein
MFLEGFASSRTAALDYAEMFLMHKDLPKQISEKSLEVKKLKALTKDIVKKSKKAKRDTIFEDNAFLDGVKKYSSWHNKIAPIIWPEKVLNIETINIGTPKEVARKKFLGVTLNTCTCFVLNQISKNLENNYGMNSDDTKWDRILNQAEASKPDFSDEEGYLLWCESEKAQIFHERSLKLLMGKAHEDLISRLAQQLARLNSERGHLNTRQELEIDIKTDLSAAFYTGLPGIVKTIANTFCAYSVTEFAQGYEDAIKTLPILEEDIKELIKTKEMISGRLSSLKRDSKQKGDITKTSFRQIPEYVKFEGKVLTKPEILKLR